VNCILELLIRDNIALEYEEVAFELDAELFVAVGAVAELATNISGLVDCSRSQVDI